MSAELTGTRAAPLDAAHAARALEKAADREQVFEILLRAVRAHARFAALLSVHADHLRGRRALAEAGFETSRVAELRIERDTVAALEAVIASREPAVGAIATGEPFIDGMLETLGGLAPVTLVLPVIAGARTVALVVAHRGDEAMAGDEDLAGVFALIAIADRALARLTADRSQRLVIEPAPARAETQADGYDVLEVEVDVVAARRAALADHRKTRTWIGVVEAIHDLIREGVERGEPDEDEQLELLVELGRVEAEHLKRPDRAIEAWRGAQSIDAGDARILDALEALFEREQRWSEYVDSLEKRVALADTRAARIAALTNLAQIARERLPDDERAIAAYERLLQLDPDNELAARALETIHVDGKQWEAVVALQLERGDLDAAAAIYEDKLGDARSAFLVWITALRGDPSRLHLVEHLDRLAPAADAWNELVLEATALAGTIPTANAETAAALWHLVGRWQRNRLGNLEAAIDALEHSLRLAPRDVDALYELLETLRVGERWTELAALLATTAEAEPAPAVRSELLAELGDVTETRLGRPEDAIASYQRALADDPESMTVLVALHRCYLATEAWPELGDILPRLIDALSSIASRPVIVELQVELGSVLASHLDRPDDAVRAFRDALELDPQNTAALEGLAATGRTDALLEATELGIDAAPREEQLRRYGDIAAAWHEDGRFDRASACWQKLLALDPKQVGAHQGLVRALQAAEHWGPCVVAMHALLRVLEDPHERIEILVALAAVFEGPLRDRDGATAAYREIITIGPHHHGALEALGRLYDDAGRTHQALEMLQRLLDDITDPPARADLLQRIGHAHLGARDAVNARLAFVQAIALDLDNARAREGMARAHVQQGEVVAAGEELLRAARLYTSEPDVLRCLLDAAWLYLHRLDDAGRARECLQRVLELAPDHADAKQGLADLLAKTQEWETLWPHLEQEVARVTADDALEPAERNEVYLRAARCAVELANFPTALELFDLAASTDPRPATQIERADALYRSKALDAAALAYQTILTQHAATLPRPQLLELYRRLAAIYTELGKATQAQQFHHKVLDIDPIHTSTLVDLTELHLARAQFDDAIGTLRMLASNAAPAERTTYLERIGDLYRDKLESRPRAMSTYLDALELDPANRRLLQRLLDLQTAAGQWKPAVDTIARFLEHETDAARRGAYFLAAAEIRRSHLKDAAAAAGDYEAALDELFRAPPTTATRSRAMDAFQIVVDLATADHNYKAVEQAYRRMIKRLAPDDRLLIPMWHGLGDVYRTQLAHPQSAIEAYEVAHSLDPDKSAHRSRLLAELYATTGAQQPTHTTLRASKLVDSDPTNPDAYRAIGRAAFEAKRIDEAWCVARALAFLKQANPQEQALYAEYQTHEVRKATGIIDDDAWALVRHPEESQTLGSIFALIWEAIAALRAGPAKSFELKAKERMPVEHDARVVAKIFRHAARLVNVSLPDVYIQPRRPGRLLLANVLDKAGRLIPTIIVGRDLMTGYRDTELAAAVGAMLALLRPAYYLKLALPTVEELTVALAAAAQVIGKPAPAALEAGVAAIAPEIQKRLTRPTAEALHALIHRLPETVDLGRWRNTVDAAAQRAGLLVSGELAATARMLSSGDPNASTLRSSQRVQDLVAYSVSPNYFAIRQHLGVVVA